MENNSITPSNYENLSPSATAKPPRIDLQGGYSLSSCELPDIFENPYDYRTQIKASEEFPNVREHRTAERILYVDSERECTTR